MRLICILLFCLPVLCFSQVYNFEHFDQNQLKANFFYDFDQNSRGELFIASSKGLIKYNGHEFEIYNSIDSLFDDFVSEVFIDSKDNIWIAYYKGGLSLWEKDKAIKTISENIYVYEIFENSSGELQILTEDDLYAYTKGELHAIESYNSELKVIDLDKNSSLKLYKNQTVFIDKDGEETYQLDSGVVDFAFSKNKSTFFLLKEDRISIYTAQNQQKPYFEESFLLTELGINSNVTAIVMSKRQAILGTEKNGLFEVYLNPGYQSFSVQNFTNENGLAVDKINCLFIDREENLWIGSYGDGISMIPQKRISRHALTTNKTQNEITKFEYFQGQLFIGTKDGLRFLKDLEQPFIAGLNGKEITAIKTKNDTLWVGTNEGLFYMNKNKVQKFEFPLLKNQPRVINAIQFNGSSIFVGTNNGLYSYDFATKNSIIITNNDGLAHNVIEHFIIDKSRTFWFASPNSPIYSYQDGEFTYHKNIEGFKSFNVTEIRELRNGQIWIGTGGDGLFVYDKGKFTQYTSEKDGLFSDYIYFINETRDNKVVIGHKSSLTIVDISQYEYKFSDLGFTKELEYILPRSNYLSSSNYQWIGTYKGAVKIPKINNNVKNYIPELILENVKINEEIQAIGDHYELKYGKYFVEFNFSANYLLNSKSIEYQCFLEGFDTDWTTLSFEENNMRYQSLSDGEYTFRLRLLMNGKQTNEDIVVKITIQKPYWKSTWFYVLLFFIVLSLIILSIALTNRRNKQIKIKLQSEVKKRTADLVKKNEEVALLSNQYLEAKNSAEYRSQQIEESITYARYIQKVLLRKKDYDAWIKSFKSFFLIFKPKDVVSGDFYWGHKKDEFAYVAVADCTGHGVPGAMISMLGASFLNDSIPYLNDTDELLESLRKRVIDDFDQGEESQVSDGMDICLMRLNIKTKEVQYSGAMNPIFIVREKKNDKGIEGLQKSLENDDLVIYTAPADKQPIGYYFKMKPFSKMEFTLQEGDQVFLLSDGYVDQFGGDQYKKFMRKNLFYKFFEIYNMSSEDQKKELWDTMVTWIGEQEQIDDISIIGIKI